MPLPGEEHLLLAERWADQIKEFVTDLREHKVDDFDMLFLATGMLFQNGTLRDMLLGVLLKAKNENFVVIRKSADGMAQKFRLVPWENQPFIDAWCEGLFQDIAERFKEHPEIISKFGFLGRVHNLPRAKGTRKPLLSEELYGEEGDLPTENPDPHVNFLGTFAEGRSATLTGPKGGGKSLLGAELISFALEAGCLTATNLSFQSWRPDDTLPDDGEWMTTYPKGLYRVVDFYGLFVVIEMAIRQGRRLFVVLDEVGALAHAMRKGESAVNSHVRDTAAFVAVSRHLAGISLVFITQNVEQLGTAYRTLDALIDLHISKPSARWGYSRKELSQWYTSEGGGRTAHRKVDLYGLGNTEEWAKEHPGEPVYVDSISPFDRGMVPGTKREFDLGGCLDALGEADNKKEYADIIHTFLHPQSASATGEEGDEGEEPTEDDEPEIIDGQEIDSVMIGKEFEDLPEDRQARLKSGMGLRAKGWPFIAGSDGTLSYKVILRNPAFASIGMERAEYYRMRKLYNEGVWPTGAEQGDET